MAIPLQTIDGNSARPAVCTMIRTKTAFAIFDANDEQASWEAGESTTAIYWCLCTMQTAGPDDALVHPQSCRQGRTCYQAND
jgi:hypothetical protein